MDHLDISIATQFFSPIVASYASLSTELQSPYSAIRTENGFIFVLKQVRFPLCVAFGRYASLHQIIHQFSIFAMAIKAIHLVPFQYSAVPL